MVKYLEEFKRLSGEPFRWLYEADSPSLPNTPNSYLGGQADLTPIRHRAREAIEALNDCLRAADSGKADDVLDALRRAKAAIEAALGGQVGPYANTSAIPSMGPGGPIRP